MHATLIGVAAVAGLATFLSPCVLPILPVVAAASAQGGRRRPLGIATGLAVAFTVFTLTASRLLSALDLPQDLLRNLAIALLAVVGVLLLVPQLGESASRLLAPLGRAPGSQPRGDGFWSGVAVGGALALVWTPCAGPILAAISVVSAEKRVSAELVAITVAYALGATLPLFAVALAGNRAASRVAAVRRAGPGLRRAAGAVLVAGAVLATTSIPTDLAASAPSYVSGLQRIERSGTVRHDLGSLTRAHGAAPSASAASATPDALRDYGAAPDFRGITRWLNTPRGRPLSLAGLRGKVVLVDFWTYSCVNCIRTLPYLKAWDARYRGRGLVIVGVHTPEFAFEHVVGNVREAIAEHGIRYPVAVDDGYATWNAWGNQYWPADYLIDRRGHVRDAHFGEGAYAQTERDIRQLLGEPATGAVSEVTAIAPSRAVQTPETYLGTFRAAAYRQPVQRGRESAYRLPSVVLMNTVALGGRWSVDREQIVAGAGARLVFRYGAPRIYLVAAPPAGRAVSLGVHVDGRPQASVHVDRDDLYQLAHIAGRGSHLLRLDVPAGTRLYSFTFG